MSQHQLGGSKPLHSKWLYDRFLLVVIYPSIWVSAAIASLVFFTQATLSLPFDWQPVALIFAIALIPYNLDRIVDSYFQKIPDNKVQSYFRNPSILLLLLVAVLATAILLYAAPATVRLISCGVLVPLLYGIPLLPIRQQQQIRWYRLKDIPGTKAWIVAGTVTYAVVAVTLAYAGTAFDLAAQLTTVFLLVFTSSNAHIFDIRDVESDQKKGVKTLPLIIGVWGTRIVFTILNLLVLVIVGWSIFTRIPVPSLAVVLPVTLATLLYVWKLNTKTPRNVYNIWIDGCLFLPALLTWILN